MRLKDRKGMTAMVDAMIFIVVMGLAVTAMFAFSSGDQPSNDASAVTETLFAAKLRTCDLTETEDSLLISLPDMAAFYILTGESRVVDYIKGILDSLTQRPDSYRLDISYRGNTVTVGSGYGDPVSSFAKEFGVTYGGVIETYLEIY